MKSNLSLSTENHGVFCQSLKEIDSGSLNLAKMNQPLGKLNQFANDQHFKETMKNPDSVKKLVNKVFINEFEDMQEWGFDMDFTKISVKRGDNPFNQVDNRIKELSRAGLRKSSEGLSDRLTALKDVSHTLTYLHDNDLLHPFTMLPKQYLADFLVAAPITFNSLPAKHKRDSFRNSLPDELEYFFHFFNPSIRTFEDYIGDEIPNDLLNVVNIAKNYHHLMICTPYFQLFQEEWANGKLWRDLIDPFLLGFNGGLKKTFLVLGRWSDNGIFPLFNEMVADTMNFLTQFRNKIAKFRPSYTINFLDYKISWRDKQSRFNDQTSFKELNIPDRWLNAYKDGYLFNFLQSKTFELTTAP